MRGVMRAGSLVALLLASHVPASAQDAAGAISAYRRSHGLPGVTTDAALTALARQQAEAMARTGVLDHSVAGSFASRLDKANRGVAAENIAAGTTDFASTLAMWKKSSGHNANLLKRGVTRMGIASAPAPQSKYKMFWALIVAGPVEKPPPMMGPTQSRPRSQPVSKNWSSPSWLKKLGIGR